jgi:hypothetical protein
MLVLFTLLVVLLVLAALPWSDLSQVRATSATSARFDLTAYDVTLLPDRVRLAPTSLRHFAHSAEVRAASAPLPAQGFGRGGNFMVTGWPGLHVRLMVHRRESMIAAIHDHDVAGVWVEITSRFLEGGQLTHTTLDGQGLEPRPGHIVLRMPGISTEKLLEHAREDRSTEHLHRVRTRDASTRYEQNYETWIAWHKSRLHPERRRVVARPLKAA